MFLLARARWWRASRTNRAVCYLSSVRARCFCAFFTAVADIVVWEHWMIASLCDVVLLVNAFGDTCCALFFNSYFSCRCQSDTKPSRNCELRFFYRILHHWHSAYTKRQRHFFSHEPNFSIVFFSLLLHWIFGNFDTQHNGIQSRICKY